MSAGLHALSPLLEVGAYEALWSAHGATFKTLADRFRPYPDAYPSMFVPPSDAVQRADEVLKVITERGLGAWGVRIHGAGEYPEKLRDAKYPVELLYYCGWWDLVETRSVAVVGTRKPSEEGIARTGKLARLLVRDNFTVVSGLATGVDTAAHTAAIEAGGNTIAVIGTPLTEVYPKENRELQERIAREFLLISQVPFLRYQAQHWKVNRLFFPERNATMSALTEATVIVEAGETSGTLVQARAALDQGRKLFILESCFNKGLRWPERFINQGAIRVREYEEIREHLG